MDHVPSQVAEGKVRLGLQRIAGRYPNHAKVLERFQLVAAEAVGSLGVTVEGETVQLRFNASFVLGLSLAELGGTLLHEVGHLIFSHVIADPAEFPDVWARTVAEEVTVNEFIHEPLPVGAMRLEDFPQLPPGESTRQRYQRLVSSAHHKQKRREARSTNMGKGGGEQDCQEPQHLNGDRSCATLDNHDIWDQSLANRDQARSALQEILADAALEIGLNQVPTEVRGELESLGIGALAGGQQRRREGQTTGGINWQEKLRRCIGQALDVRPSFQRPPRRFPEMVGILPGRSRRPGKPRVLAVIDTSGSITPDLLALIDAELYRLSRGYSVRVVECDAEVQRTYEYRQLDSFHGGGGTDLRPPLAPDFLHREKAELVVYFTDGFGPAPTRAPKPPLIWCLTPGGQQPAAWGKVVQMGTAAEAAVPKQAG